MFSEAIRLVFSIWESNRLGEVRRSFGWACFREDVLVAATTDWKTIQAEPLAGQYNTFNISFPDEMLLLGYRWRDSQLLPDHFYRPRTANLESGNAFCLVSLPTKEENGETSSICTRSRSVYRRRESSIPSKWMNGLRTIVAAFSNFTGTTTKRVFVLVTPFDGKLNSLTHSSQPSPA
jgi:hypothetical protein